MDFVENITDPNAVGYDIALKNSNSEVVGNQRVTVSNVKGGENCFWLTPNGQTTPVVCIDPKNMTLTFNNESHIFDEISKENQPSYKLSKITIETNQTMEFTLETESGDKSTYKIDGNTVYKQNPETAKFEPIYRCKSFDIAVPQNLLEIGKQKGVNIKGYPKQMFEMFQKQFGYESMVSKSGRLQALKGPSGDILIVRGSKIVPTYGAEFFKDGNNSVLGFYVNNSKGIVNGKSTEGIGFKMTEEELNEFAGFIKGKETTDDMFMTTEEKNNQSVNFKGTRILSNVSKKIDETPLEENKEKVTDEVVEDENKEKVTDEVVEDENKEKITNEVIDEENNGGDDDDDNKKNNEVVDENIDDNNKTVTEGEEPKKEEPKKDEPKKDEPKKDEKPEDKPALDIAKPMSRVLYAVFIIMAAAAAFLPLSPVFMFLMMMVFTMATSLRTNSIRINNNIHPIKAIKNLFKPKTLEQLLDKEKQPTLSKEEQNLRQALLEKQKQGNITKKEEKQLEKLNKKAAKDPLSKRERKRLNKLQAIDDPVKAFVHEQRERAETLSKHQSETFEKAKESYLSNIQSNIDNRLRLLELAKDGKINITPEQTETLKSEIKSFNEYKSNIENDVLNTSTAQNETIVKDLLVAENSGTFSNYDSTSVDLTTFDDKLTKYKENHSVPEISSTYSDLVTQIQTNTQINTQEVQK